MASVSVSDVSDALLIIDMQVDFVDPRGTLYVPHAENLLADINKLSSTYRFRMQIATQDWHPPGHVSFASGTWPVHCVWGTSGASLHPDLDLQNIHHIVRKGYRMSADSNSAFRDDEGVATGLEGLLKSVGVQRVFVCGVAGDVCVFQTCMHGLDCGFEVFVLEELCVDTEESMYDMRKNEIVSKGGRVVSFRNLIQ